jgi:ferredoxin-NADP reductase
MTRKLACRVDSIDAHGERVYTVRMRAERPLPSFRPGQFLHLALDPYDPSGFWPDSRAFSIASASGLDTALELCYSVKGRFTSRMERELAVGRTVWVKLPYGDFVIEGHNDVVLMAGGTGISAFTAYLEQLPAHAPSSVVLAYGARAASLLLYTDLIRRTAEQARWFQALFFAESAEPGETTIGGAPIESGRLNVNVVWQRLPRPREAAYYISGPPAMLEAVSAELRAMGLAAEAIHTDAWE